jgi:hypothetical protein
MVVKLSKRAYEHSKELIQVGHMVLDERDAWSEHQPSAEKENEFIHQHGFREYGKWYLGIDDAENEETKGRYKFPYGDFNNVHRCGVLSVRKQGRTIQALRHQKCGSPLAWDDRCNRAALTSERGSPAD